MAAVAVEGAVVMVMATAVTVTAAAAAAASLFCSGSRRSGRVVHTEAGLKKIGSRAPRVLSVLHPRQYVATTERAAIIPIQCLRHFRLPRLPTMPVSPRRGRRKNRMRFRSLLKMMAMALCSKRLVRRKHPWYLPKGNTFDARILMLCTRSDAHFQPVISAFLGRGSSFSERSTD